MSHKGPVYLCATGGERGPHSGAGRDMLAACPSPGAVKRMARKEQLLLTHTHSAAREQLALAREGKTFITSLFYFKLKTFIKKN